MFLCCLLIIIAIVISIKIVFDIRKNYYLDYIKRKRNNNTGQKEKVVMFDLEKSRKEVQKSFGVCLEKKYKETGIEHTIYGEVKFAVDISGSMNSVAMSGELYSDGTVNEVVKRFFAAAKELDDNGEMEVYPFSSTCEMLKIPVVNNNYENYVENEIMKKRKNWYFGGTDYVPMIKALLSDCNKIPQLILCVVDGDTRNEYEAKKLIIESSKKPIYWFFIGIGNNNDFDFLKKLDKISNNKRKMLSI
jgi:hypothetical protein